MELEPIQIELEPIQRCSTDPELLADRTGTHVITQSLVLLPLDYCILGNFVSEI